ncbi:MAG TPA: S8/S53 family peptidase [Thermoanaerobaculia bacterium]|nr:S8/S53 family peptidase [Thermoanaerobaculia bacterium]
MSRKLFSLIASCLAIGMSACTTLRPPTTAKACADWRWIGISRSETRCPEIPGWTVRPLFPQLAPAWQKSDDFCKGADPPECGYCKERLKEHVPDENLIRELNRFCVYEPQHPKWIFQKPPFPAASSADLIRFDQDCAALSFADTELYPDPPVDRAPEEKYPKKEKEKWRSNYQHFFSEVGQKKELLESETGTSVRLAFLDTEPTRESFSAQSGNSPHGYTLANIARNLLCTFESPAHCAAQITTRLALPIIEFNPKGSKYNKIDAEHGGHIGMQSDLAMAIRDEVDRWQEGRQNGTSPQHLVLNLSLAWDGRLFGGLSEEWINEMRAGTQAVYWALQYAASFDVLVLAAAGNQKCEPCPNDGPLLPAAWEKDVPQEQGCPIEPRKKPLLYAVGGVDTDNRPLANARPKGMPRRAAYGETAVVTGVNLDTSEPTYNGRIYSGSSVATAVVSSIAAFVWNSDPGLDSHGVMDKLDESGNELKVPADFWFVKPAPAGSAVPLPAGSSEPPMVHRLSLSTALEPSSRVSLDPPPIERGNRSWSRGSCQPWNFPQPEDPPCAACIKPPP